MAQIKIVRIIARLNIGGPAVNASILSSFLDKERFKTKVIYGSLAEGEESLEPLMRGYGVDMVLIPELGREISPLDDLRALWKIVKILRQERPDIVHTHTAKAGTLGRIAAILTGVKVRIHTFHGNVFRHYFGKTKTVFFIWIERILGLFTTRVITVSPRQKEELTREFGIVPEKKAVVIPLGVDFSRLKSGGAMRGDLRNELGIGKELLVGILGRLVPIKNHEMFLRAASEVRKMRPELGVKFIIIGDGELKQDLAEKTATLGIGKDVYYLGWRQDLGNIYRSLDVVALTSRNEGTPLALIEAMAMGKAIIATDVGGVSDMIESGVNGVLVKRDDEAGFVRGLVNLLEDGMLRETLGKAALRTSGKFSRDNLVRAVSELYTECVRS